MAITTSANAASPVGPYPIIPGGLSSRNYAITYVDGTLAVAPAVFVVVNHSYQLTENKSLSVPKPGVLVNDSAPNGGSLTALLVRGPAHGTLKLKANGSFVYKPKANFKGTDHFTYKVRSGSLVSNVATVTFTVVSPPKKKRPKLRVAVNSAVSLARTHALVDQAISHFGEQARPIGSLKAVDDRAGECRRFGNHRGSQIDRHRSRPEKVMASGQAGSRVPSDGLKRPPLISLCKSDRVLRLFRLASTNCEICSRPRADSFERSRTLTIVACSFQHGSIPRRDG